MKILLVEDNRANRETLVELILKRDAEAEIVQCFDREAALAAINLESFFDLAILDLHLPPSQALISSAHVDQGLAVLQALRDRAPGAIIRVLTGYPQMDMASEYQDRFEVNSVLGVSALRFISKENMLQVGDIVGNLAERITKLASDVECHAVNATLSIVEERLIAYHAEILDASKANVVLLGGASGARTFRVDFYDATGTSRGRVAVKIDSLQSINRELQSYHRRVAPYLQLGAVPPLAGEKIVYYDKAAIFFRLAKEYPYTFFEYLEQHAANGKLLVEKVELQTAGWLENVVTSTETVRAYLVQFVPKLDEAIATLPADCQEALKSILDNKLRFRRSTQHSDFHGQNILVSEQGEPLILDFERVAKLQPPADPVALELSLVYHPGAKKLRGAWPTTEEAAHWADPEAFSASSSLAGVICACRAWSYRMVEPVSSHCVEAAAIGYTLWQLKFATTDREIALAIIRSAASHLKK